MTASQMGAKSVEVRRKKHGKNFNKVMRDLRLKKSKKLSTPILDERS